MELTDKDLASVQQVRNLLQNANDAKKKLAKLSQDEIDRIVLAISKSAAENAERLAKLAADETGFGNPKDKTVKNLFAAKTVYEAIKDMKTVGMIRFDSKNKIKEFASPVGIIAGIVPSTNPTSTVIYKSMIAIKSGNPIIFSPHPKALNCILETIKVIYPAALKAGLPEGSISCISIPTIEATNELMKNRLTNLILATGGPAMVKAAYSSGTPAIGVGAGNGPAFIDKSADISEAVKKIIRSKTFDNGTICASEQSIIVEKQLEDEVTAALKNNNAYIMNADESKKVASILFKKGRMNPEIVGKTASYIANLAGLGNIPQNTSVLIAPETSVGLKYPYSQEKLAPVLALYVENSTDKILERCVEILNFEGIGHSFIIHCKNDAVIERFAQNVPASRIVVNAPGSLGGIGAATNLFPALTLGCGAAGGSSSSNNISPLDLINIKRVAEGVRSVEEILNSGTENQCSINSVNRETIDYIVNSVINKLI